MHLQQHVDRTARLGGGALHVGQMRRRVHPVYHRHEANIVFQLLRLQMAYEMPLHVGGQHGGLVTQLGGIVLAKQALSGPIGLLNVRGGLQLAHSHHPHALRQLLSYMCYVFCNHDIV